MTPDISQRTSAPVLFAPFAGALYSTTGELVTCLVARHHNIAITASGSLVTIDRPSEWLDDTFTSWHELPLHDLNADAMAHAIAIVEHLLCLPRGTLSAESLPPALMAMAAGVSLTLKGFQERITPHHSPRP